LCDYMSNELQKEKKLKQLDAFISLYKSTGGDPKLAAESLFSLLSQSDLKDFYDSIEKFTRDLDDLNNFAKELQKNLNSLKDSMRQQ